jgi:zinc transport system ATP-binding protein
MSILVKFDAITKYFGSKLLLDNISFQIQQGSIVTLVGQNGAGKTTIARLILGIIKYDSGKLYIKNGTKIGYVPQNLALNHNMPMTAGYMLKLLVDNKSYDTAILDGYFPEFHDLEDNGSRYYWS